MAFNMLGSHLINGLVGVVGGKTFLKPEIVPPLGGHQVAEPLVGDLVSQSEGGVLFFTLGGRVVHEGHILSGN